MFTYGPSPLTGQQETALFHCVRGGRVEMVNRLLDSGADPTLVNDLQQTVLMVAAINHRSEVLFDLLMDAQAAATIDRVDKEGRTALTLACIYGDDVAVVQLLDAQADFTVVDRHGLQALDLAEKFGRDFMAGRIEVRGLTGTQPLDDPR
jgi:ankyrin repeat protein